MSYNSRERGALGTAPSPLKGVIDMDLDREEIMERVVEAVAEYKDVGTEDVDTGALFSRMDLEPVDVLSIGREVCQQFEMDPPDGVEFSQTIEELVDLICQ